MQSSDPGGAVITGDEVRQNWGTTAVHEGLSLRVDHGITVDRILDRMHDNELVGAPESESPFVLHGLSRRPIQWRATGAPS